MRPARNRHCHPFNRSDRPRAVITIAAITAGRPPSGYDKATQGRDIAAVMDALKVEKADLVTHDIGNMVGYALAAQFPDRITKWVVIDAPLPGIGPWEEILKSPLLWHFNFRGPDVDRLVTGRERIYLDRFYNELSANPKAIDEATREHYAKLYARPGNMHFAFEQFATFNTKDAPDNKAFVAKAKTHGAHPGSGSRKILRRIASCYHARGRQPC